MANTIIQIKYSGASGNVPGSLQSGELAINLPDGKLYYGNVANQAVLFDTVTEPSGLNGEIQFNKSGSFGSNSSLVFVENTQTLQVSKIVSDTATIGGYVVPTQFAGLTQEISNTSLQANAAFTRANVANSTATSASSYANSAYTKANNALANTSGILAGDLQINGLLKVYGTSGLGGGDEGGQIDLVKAQSNTTLNTGVTIDVYQNKLRIFETGGTNRGVFIDLANSASSTVGTDLLSSSGSIDNTARSSAQSAYNHANASFGVANTANGRLDQDVKTTSIVTFNSVITSNNGTGFNYKVGDDAWIGDTNIANTIRIKGQQDSSNGYIAFGSNTSQLGVSGTGQLTYNANTVWNAGNDGASSGLDADLLDGLQGSSYARSSAETYANAAFTQANTANTNVATADQRAVTSGSYANAAFGVANTSANTATSASSYANSAYTQANTATTNAATADQKALSAGSYANVAFNQANTATTNAATADQKAVSAGVYANSAYAQANTVANNATSASSYANSAYTQANTAANTATSASSYANSAYTQANTATTNAATADQRAVTSGVYANAAFTQANTATNNAASASSYANGSFTVANTASVNALSAGSYANGAFLKANTADQRAVTSGVYANAAFALGNTNSTGIVSTGNYANAAYSLANASAVYANASFFLKTGGSITGNVSITGDLAVTGNLTITGNTTTISANNLSINDTLIYLGANNTGNIADIGIIGQFTQGNYQHTGIVRDHVDGKWKFFSNVASEPTGTNVSFPGTEYYDTVKVGIIESTSTANIGALTYVGTNFTTPLGGATNPIIGGLNNSNNYVQVYVLNSSNGKFASADLVAYPNNGNDASGWIDVGITSNTFSFPTFSVTGANEGYLFMSAPVGSSTSGNLVIATDSTGTNNSIEFYLGGFAQTKGSSANIKFTTQASSTSNTTGAAIIKGGLGVSNNLYADAIYDNGVRTAFTANSASSYANGAFTVANTASINATSAGSYANGAFVKANTATTNAATADQRAVTSGVYANSAYLQANTATTNAATADQRAVTSGSYANSAYTQSNTAVSNAASASSYANSAFAKANTIPTQVNATDDSSTTLLYPIMVGAAGSTQTIKASTSKIYFNASTGTIYATAKSFSIPHPTQKGKTLVYGSLEGPENGVYVRGRLVDKNVIELPEYWTNLVDEDTITVTLTPIGSHQNLYVDDIKDNAITIVSDKHINCFYLVHGERKDVAKLEVEI